MKKVFFSLLVLILLALAATAAADTTVMMYMCGSDIQDDCVTDMQEMVKAQCGDDVTIVVLAGGATSWSDRELKANKLNLFTIKNGKRSSVTDWGKANMGSSDTLVKFVTYCWNNYRADRNMLVLWDHGSSAAYGMCFDMVYNDDGLTLNEISTALKTLKNNLNGFHLNIIGADACLMACYEMAAIVAPYADYYVASEELEPYLGWYYVNWLKALSENGSMSDLELAKAIVNAFKYACEKDNPKDYLTLSVIDLSKMSTLSTYVDSMASILRTQLLNGQTSVISRTLQSTYIFGSYDNAGSDMIDLTDLINLCAMYDSDTAAKASAALKDVVAYSYANSYVPDAEGLSIFVPMENSSYYSSFKSDYAADAISGYTGFVGTFASQVAGSSYTFTATNTTPYQMSSNDYDDDFWGSYDSCYGYDDCYDDDDWDWGWNWGWSNYGYGSGFGYNTSSGFVIAGSAGNSQYADTQTGSTVTKPTAAPSGGFVIAGSTGSQPTAKPTAAPTASTGGFVIAGGSSQPTATPGSSITVTGTVTAAPASTPSPAMIAAAAGSYGFKITLSDEDMHYLSYAELVLYQNYSNDETYDLDEMGYVQNVWIDWNKNTVYALFDGTWPSLDDLLVVMYEQSRTEYGRRCIIPVMLNGTQKTYLVVEYENGSKTGEILGTSEGWSSNGLPVRGITALNKGDTLTPVYPSVTGENTGKLDLNALSGYWSVYDDDPDFVITYDGTQKIEAANLPATDYLIGFRLHDIFGESVMTELIPFSIEE